MNVTIHVPAPLLRAMEGRRKVELGMPAGAELGDLLQALFTLYPKLAEHVAGERENPEPGSVQVQVLLEPGDPAPGKLKDGAHVYLVAPKVDSAGWDIYKRARML